MSVRIHAFLAVLILLAAGTANADVLYCKDRNRSLYLAMIDHDSYVAGERPRETLKWPCTARLFIQGQPLRQETGYESSTEKTLFAWADDAVLNGLQADAIEAEKRRRGLPQDARLVTHLEDFDALITAYSFSIFRNEILAGSSVNNRLSKLAFYSSFVRATVKIESDGNLTSLSSAGAMGLIQIMPSTVQDTYKGIGPKPNPFKVEDNLLYGIHEIFKKMNKVVGWMNADRAEWESIVRDAKGKPVKYIDRYGKERFRTVHRSMSGFDRSKWVLYTSMVYNMGANGWPDWEYAQRKNGAPSNVMRPYALKALRYMQEYCPGIDIANARCEHPKAWFATALSDPMNAWLLRPGNGGIAP